MQLSIIISVYNEEKSVLPLFKSIKEVITPLNTSYEVIFVDDGSTDKTYENLINLKNTNKEVKVVSFTRNFGKSAALSAGFSESSGDLIITMDGDLEEDPHEIPLFLDAIRRGNDMVVGWRYKRKHSFRKRFFSNVYNWLIQKTTGITIRDSNCGFKIMKRRVIDKLHLYSELHRYIPSMASLAGFKVGEIKISHSNRKYGKSKYGPIRIVIGFLDLLTVNFLLKYSLKPLHFFGSFGLGLCSLGSFIIAFLYIRKFFFGIFISTLPFLFVIGILALILGIQFISLGLLGEMIIRNSNKKNYVLR